MSLPDEPAGSPQRGRPITADPVEGSHADLRWAYAWRPLYPEEPCGDAALVRPFDGGCLVAVIDGGGHGAPAAAAAQVALARLELSVLVALRDAGAREALGPATLCRHCHRALRASCGAAAGLALLLAAAPAAPHTLIWGGVGNVRGLLERAGEPRRLLPMAEGSLGRRLPATIPAETLTLQPGDVLVMATDGLERAITRAPVPAEPTAGDKARAYLRDFRRGGDDCLALVLELDMA